MHLVQVPQTPETLSSVRVWIRAAPEIRPGIEDAVRDSGGEVVGHSEANAIVWMTDDIASIRPFLSSAVTWVQISSAGVDEWFERGLIDDCRTWTAAQGVYAEPIAEYVVGMMLAVVRRLGEVITTNTWKPLEIGLLRDKTIGLIGAGEIGEAVLRLLAPFGVHTLALTRSGRQVPGADESFDSGGLDLVLGASDFVVLATPATPETVGLLSRASFDVMRPGAWIVNVGRGVCLDTNTLVEFLTDQRLGGAILDVTDPEPLPDDHPLWRLPNVVITSHTASTPRLGARRFEQRVRENVRRRRFGQTLVGTVDLVRKY